MSDPAAIRPLTPPARVPVEVAGDPAGVPKLSRVALVGNPNVGKSVIFGALGGRYVTVSNYPGTTVEVVRGSMSLQGERIPLIDTPGANGLVPQSEDERVTRDLLLEGPTTVLQVADTKHLARALALTIQLAEAGLPAALCLNMSDEAESRGIRIDTDELSRILGIPVVQTVATRRQGLSRLPDAIASARVPRLQLDYGDRIEDLARRVAPLLPPSPVSSRALALAAISGDATLSPWLTRHLPERRLRELEEAVQSRGNSGPAAVASAMHRRRMQAAQDLARRVGSNGSRPRARTWEGIGSLTMHPLWGLPIVAAVLVALYQFVGVLGAQVAVDRLENDLFGTRSFIVEASRRAGSAEIRVAPPGLEGTRLDELSLVADPPGSLAGPPRPEPDGSWSIPVAEGAPERIGVEGWTGLLNPRLRRFLIAWSPSILLTDLLAGEYGLLTMGATYAIAIVLPIVVTFFFAFSVLEDSGYLPRLAVMLNRLFRLIGLNGRAVLPMILGLGCDTMATLTTRILGTRKERLLVILLLALGVPCSAQLGVILGMLAGVSWEATLVWAGVVGGVMMLVGWIAARILPGERLGFVMEIPPLRAPMPANLIRKTLARVEWYLKEAVPLFLLGTLVLFLADRVGLLGLLERAAEPLLTGMLGLPGATAEAFIIGFLRRDFGAAGLYRLSTEGALDGVQVVVSLVTMTLFIPCIAHLFMIVKEQGARVAALVAAFIFPFALLVGAALNAVLRLVGADL